MRNFTLTVLVLQCLVLGAQGHGYLTCPLPRMYRDDKVAEWTNWMGIAVPGTLEFAEGVGNAPNLNAGIGGGGDGARREKEVGHGLCGDIGDRRGYMEGGPYGPTKPRGVYKQGGVIDVDIKLTAYHQGWFEFRLCVPDDQAIDTKTPITQECLNQHVLQIAPSTPHYDKVLQYQNIDGGYRCSTTGGVVDPTATNPSPVWPKGSCCNEGGACSPPDQNTDRFCVEFVPESERSYTVHLVVPEGVVCDRCVLQWLYQTGNSRDTFPETFYNCADIKIVGADSSETTGCAAHTPTPSEDGGSSGGDGDSSSGTIVSTGSANSCRKACDQRGIFSGGCYWISADACYGWDENTCDQYQGYVYCNEEAETSTTLPPTSLPPVQQEEFPIGKCQEAANCETFTTICAEWCDLPSISCDISDPVLPTGHVMHRCNCQIGTEKSVGQCIVPGPLNPDVAPSPSTNTTTTDGVVSEYGLEPDMTIGRVVRSAQVLPVDPVVNLSNLDANVENVKRVMRVFPSSRWNKWFAFANINSGPNKEPFNYENFLKAVAKFPYFCGEGVVDHSKADDLCKQELVVLMAMFVQETGANSPAWGETWKQGLYFFEEIGCESGTCTGYNSCGSFCHEFPCAEGETYHGRGAHQLSYCYNYGPFSLAMFGDDRVLKNPSMITQGWLGLASALWFFMTPASPKPSMHDVIVGHWTPNVQDEQAGLSVGLGIITNIINGGLECGSGTESRQSTSRINAFTKMCADFGISKEIRGNPVADGCKDMKPFPVGGTAGSIPAYWDKDWSSTSCKAVTIQTPYSYFLPNSKARCELYHYGKEFVGAGDGSGDNDDGTAGSGTNSGQTTVRCGVDWNDANSKCGAICADNGQCPDQESCFAGVDESRCDVDGVPTTGGTGSGSDAKSSARCGKSWKLANSECTASCNSNSDCPVGDTCFAEVNTAICGDSVLSGVTNTNSDAAKCQLLAGQSLGNHMLGAFVENWLDCPSDAQLAQYTHVFLSYANTYTWTAGGNECSPTCYYQTGTTQACTGNSLSEFVERAHSLGVKVVLAFGGPGMGVSWEPFKPQCWKNCLDNLDSLVANLLLEVKESGVDGVNLDYQFTVDAQYADFIEDWITRMRDGLDFLGNDKLLTLSPLASDLEAGSMMSAMLSKGYGAKVDYLMPQYFKSSKLDVAKAVSDAVEWRKIENHYRELSRMMGGEHKLVFGHCNGECSMNTDSKQALAIAKRLDSIFPENAGSYFWSASRDTPSATWSVHLAQYYCDVPVVTSGCPQEWGTVFNKQPRANNIKTIRVSNVHGTVSFEQGTSDNFEVFADYKGLTVGQADSLLALTVQGVDVAALLEGEVLVTVPNLISPDDLPDPEDGDDVVTVDGGVGNDDDGSGDGTGTLSPAGRAGPSLFVGSLLSLFLGLTATTSGFSVSRIKLSAAALALIALHNMEFARAEISQFGTLNIAYYTAWSVYGRAFPPSQVDVTKLTHVMYAFANIKNGECVLGDPYADIQNTFGGLMKYKADSDMSPGNHNGNIGYFNTPGKFAREKNPNLKTLISVGGWSWSKDFSPIARSATSRKKFIDSCTKFMLDYNFDGIDIDWEFPITGGLETNIYDPRDRDTYTLLMDEFRAAMDALPGTNHYELSIASSQNPKYLRENYDLAGLARSLDFFNVMTYDYNGCWGSKVGHQTPLYCNPQDPNYDDGFCIASTVQTFLDAGVPRCKILVGVAFYGRAFGKVPNSESFSSASDWLGTEWDNQNCPMGQYEKGIDDYKKILALEKNGFERIWDDVAMAPLMVNTMTGDVWSYDDTESARAKANYVKAEQLGGTFFWSIDGDVISPSDSLNSALWDVMKDYRGGECGSLPPTPKKTTSPTALDSPTRNPSTAPTTNPPTTLAPTPENSEDGVCDIVVNIRVKVPKGCKIISSDATTGEATVECADIFTDLCASDNGGCQHNCAVGSAGTPICSCNERFSLGPDGASCILDNPCDNNNGGCHHLCVFQQGSVACSCFDNFKLAADTKTCTAVDNCDKDYGGCDPSSTFCTFVSPGVSKCTCKPGFLVETSTTCSPKPQDPCKPETNPCDPTAGTCFSDQDSGEAICSCPAGKACEDDSCSKCLEVATESACSEPNWVDGAVYTQGDCVQHEGNKYCANHWTKSDPATNSGVQYSGLPWVLVSACSSEDLTLTYCTSHLGCGLRSDASTIVCGETGCDDTTCCAADPCTAIPPPCSQICTPADNFIFTCSCLEGFYQSPNTGACLQEDACLNNNNWCSDICIGPTGECACTGNQILGADEKTCEAKPEGSVCGSDVSLYTQGQTYALLDSVVCDNASITKYTCTVAGWCSQPAYTPCQNRNDGWWPSAWTAEVCT